MTIITEEKSLSGWGNVSPTLCKVFEPKDYEDLKSFLGKLNPNDTVIARGMGRAYNNSAQNGGAYVIDFKSFNKVKCFNSQEGVITCESGVVLKDLLSKVVPAGWFCPVVPGTKYVSVGGMVAADIHGKNHHCDGSFGDYVEEITLLNNRLELVHLTGRDELFWFTIGGLGLTGFIVDVTFRLMPIKSSDIEVKTYIGKNLKHTLQILNELDTTEKYTVAWLDSLSGGNSLGRSIVMCGNHSEQNSSLEYREKKKINLPFYLPNRSLNKYTVKLFNNFWFYKGRFSSKVRTEDIDTFFFPLDMIENWNKIYGDQGFIQYQIVVPLDRTDIVGSVVDGIYRKGYPSFLTVFKRFKSGNKAVMSFPKEGWTVTFDFPICYTGLLSFLDEIDKMCVEAGGRVYLVKDSRVSSDLLGKMYKNWPVFIKKVREINSDPKRCFSISSDLYIRLTT